jgi:hypothetical protein
MVSDVVKLKTQVSERKRVNLAFQNDNYYVNDILSTIRRSIRKPSAKWIPDKQTDHITEAGGYCVFKKPICRISQVLYERKVIETSKIQRV